MLGLIPKRSCTEANWVETKGVEPSLPACDADVFPLHYIPICGATGNRTPIYCMPCSRPPIER